MVLCRWNDSSIWLKGFCFKSSKMNKWHLISLATHLNWHGFLENFLASSGVQLLQVKSSMHPSELKWLSLWQATSKDLEKYNLVCSPHVLIKSTMQQIWLLRWKKKLISLLFLWSGDMDIKRFLEKAFWRYWPNKLSMLISWGTGKTLMLIKRCWSTSSKPPANYLTTYR